MTTEQQKSLIQKWQTDCQHVEDIIKSCPALTDMALLLAWYDDAHGWLIYVGNEKARAETAYKMKCADDLKGDAIPANAWQYIKGSSTMLNQYLAGINPELYAIWQRLENLSRNMETILSDMRTLLVSLRQTESREDHTTKNQGAANNAAYRPGEIESQGAPFIRDHIIQVTEKAFDDFAGGNVDEGLLKKIIGL